MNEYEVEVPVSGKAVISIWADNREQAISKALKIRLYGDQLFDINSQRELLVGDKVVEVKTTSLKRIGFV